MMPLLDRIVLSARYILIVFYLGLVVALALYAVKFLYKVGKFALDLSTADDTDYLLKLLEMVDSALVSGLVVMVLLSSWDSFVSPLSKAATGGSKIEWVSQLDPTNLKTKLATAIVAISSIHLLQVFMRAEEYPGEGMLWRVIIHITFIAGALALFWMDHTGTMRKAAKVKGDTASALDMPARTEPPEQPVHRPEHQA
jgi:uncharacterized protein (TIGR00645 family)